MHPDLQIYFFTNTCRFYGTYSKFLYVHMLANKVFNVQLMWHSE